MAACYRALHARAGVRLSVYSFRLGQTHEDYEDEVAADLPWQFLTRDQWQVQEHLASILQREKPDAVFLPGWSYRACNGLLRNGAFSSIKFVMGSDQPWWGAWRQRLNALRVRRVLRRVDRFVVPGERGWQCIRNLGVPESKIHRGAQYGVDDTAWRPLWEQRTNRPDGWPRQFLYVGRFVSEKALDLMLDAHGRYRSRHADAWPLSCCGQGPMADLVEAAPDVRNHGFVQPAEMPAVFAAHGVLINAARYDPWPLVIVEACASGMPVIASEACGSVVEVVRPYHNGLTVPTGDTDALARAMSWAHEHHERLPQMGLNGQTLAAAFSAEAWADRWEQMLAELAE